MKEPAVERLHADTGRSFGLFKLTTDNGPAKERAQESSAKRHRAAAAPRPRASAATMEAAGVTCGLQIRRRCGAPS
jgi:hypothetical protein